MIYSSVVYDFYFAIQTSVEKVFIITVITYSIHIVNFIHFKAKLNTKSHVMNIRTIVSVILPTIFVNFISKRNFSI